MKKPKASYSGRLKSYLEVPLITAVMLVILAIGIWMINSAAGMVVSAFAFVYIIVIIILTLIYRPRVMKDLVSFAMDYGQIQKKMLDEFSIPYGLLDVDGKVIWMNQQMRLLFEKGNHYHRSISSILPEVTQDKLPDTQNPASIQLSFHERDYHIELRRIRLDDWNTSGNLLSLPEDQHYLYTMYVFDNTDLKKAHRAIMQQRLVIGLIYIDNYDDVIDSIDDVRRSLLLALVDRKIDRFVSTHHGIMKKIDNDKYYIIVKQKYLTMMEADRFSLLEDVKTVSIGNDMKFTLSIGVGVNGVSYIQTYDFAHAAIELALGRGGDQAVVKDNNTITYYGGKSQQKEKSTRVKARVKAQALREFIITRNDVVIMGHKVTDIDSLGAAIGIYRAAKVLGKRAYILVDENSASIHPYLNMFRQHKDYENDMFINHRDADELVVEDTVLVVVDTNRPSNTEYPELLNRTKTIAVLDHHRQSSEVISNATLSYIEPYASSACEMVAEILQYFDDGVKLTSMEADCVYAGILVDTNNFVAKTGVRTFEAAAYLRRCGADVTRVHKLMRNDMSEYKARAEVVRHAQLFMNCYAISTLTEQDLESPTTVGAQAANELLNINGVKASFVLCIYNDMIYISARSIDEVNVQIIMERLGGGGHMNIAGAQLKDISMDRAVDYLKETIQTMTEEKAI